MKWENVIHVIHQHLITSVCWNSLPPMCLHSLFLIFAPNQYSLTFASLSLIFSTLQQWRRIVWLLTASVWDEQWRVWLGFFAGSPENVHSGGESVLFHQ